MPAIGWHLPSECVVRRFYFDDRCHRDPGSGAGAAAHRHRFHMGQTDGRAQDRIVRRWNAGTPSPPLLEEGPVCIAPQVDRRQGSRPASVSMQNNTIDNILGCQRPILILTLIIGRTRLGIAVTRKGLLVGLKRRNRSYLVVVGRVV